jgi:uncharacterized coiled-coil DUF342 family protein
MNFLVMIAIILLTSVPLMSKNGAQMQEHYKKIADGLIGIRREYPVTQPKVYGLLDQLDKLLSRAKKIVQKKQQYKQKVQTLNAENTVLKQELATVRNEVSNVKKSIESARNELALRVEEEKKRADQLSHERKVLAGKLAALEQKKDENLVKESFVKNVSKNLQKQEIDELATEKVASATHPSLRRISTSEPRAPR